MAVAHWKVEKLPKSCAGPIQLLESPLLGCWGRGTPLLPGWGRGWGATDLPRCGILVLEKRPQLYVVAELEKLTPSAKPGSKRLFLKKWLSAPSAGKGKRCAIRQEEKSEGPRSVFTEKAHMMNLEPRSNKLTTGTELLFHFYR